MSLSEINFKPDYDTDTKKNIELIEDLSGVPSIFFLPDKEFRSQYSIEGMEYYEGRKITKISWTDYYIFKLIKLAVLFAA
ncbi:hypothetical protein MXB_2789, partial [Myxobolus squamalis]